MNGRHRCPNLLATFYRSYINDVFMVVKHFILLRSWHPWPDCPHVRMFQHYEFLERADFPLESTHLDWKASQRDDPSWSCKLYKMWIKLAFYMMLGLWVPTNILKKRNRLCSALCCSDGGMSAEEISSSISGGWLATSPAQRLPWHWGSMG